MLNMGQPVVVVEDNSKRHGCLVTLLWFIFIGSWASLAWIFLSWLFIVLVITMPIGLVMINKLPKIASLREPGHTFVAVTQGMTTRIQQASQGQRSFLLRALYFVIVGWWFSLVWLVIAWVASITLIGLPLTIWMYNRVPAVTTLKRY
jgi:uncharacterized membrane protein YccF (DUF307 family)